MNRYVIDINDMGIRQALVRDGDIQHLGEVSSGIAVKRGKKIVFGNEAESARAYAPRDLCDQFWERLDTGIVQFGNFQCNHAELAAKHLGEIYRKNLKALEVIGIIPAHYQETQRGILTAIAQNKSIPLRYIIQRPLAHCSSLLGKAHIHIDLGLKFFTVSCLATKPAMSVVDSSISHDAGYAGFVRRWLNGIAAEFVSRCRIDPLHSAESEQRIRSCIPLMLDALAADHEGVFPLTVGPGTNEAKIEVNTALVTGWSISLLAKIQKEVKKMVGNCPSCAGIHLSFEASRLPGLQTLISKELDMPVVSSVENEIFKGVSEDWPPLASDDRCLYLPYRQIYSGSP